MFFRIKNFEEYQNLICKIDCVSSEIEVRRYIHSIVMNALEKRMEEIGAEKDWTIAPWDDQAFDRNDRSLYVRYAYNANVIADVQFDCRYPISFNISRPIFAMGSLSDVTDFVDACAEYLENGTIPEVEPCP